MLFALLFSAALADDGLGTRIVIDPTNDLRSPLVFDAVAYAAYSGETSTDEQPAFGDPELTAPAADLDLVVLIAPPSFEDASRKDPLTAFCFATDAMVDLFDSNVALGGPDTTSRIVCGGNACVVVNGADPTACETYDHPNGTIYVCE